MAKTAFEVAMDQLDELREERQKREHRIEYIRLRAKNLGAAVDRILKETNAIEGGSSGRRHDHQEGTPRMV